MGKGAVGSELAVASVLPEFAQLSLFFLLMSWQKWSWLDRCLHGRCWNKSCGRCNSVTRDWSKDSFGRDKLSNVCIHCDRVFRALFCLTHDVLGAIHLREYFRIQFSKVNVVFNFLLTIYVHATLRAQAALGEFVTVCAESSTALRCGIGVADTHEWPLSKAVWNGQLTVVVTLLRYGLLKLQRSNT